MSFFERVNYLHIVPQVVREPERWRGAEGDPFGGDFLEHVARTQRRTRDSRLRKILAALRIAVPQLETLEPHQDESGVWHLQGKYRHWRPTGKFQSEAEFSDGTLRLFGLLWALLDGTGPLLLEEPELSLHGEVVRHLPQMFARMQQGSRRQIIVSTHSRELLHDSGIGLDEVLLLNPSAEGTTVSPAASLDDADELLSHGVGLDEIVIPRTSPPRPDQLALFGS